MRPRRGALAAAAASVALAALTAAPAAAHETREVDGLTMVVGFGSEPAFENEPNAVSLSLSRGDRPVVDGVELELEVGFGEETTQMALEPAFVLGVFGEPGTYDASFIPTRPGQYTFRFTGTVGDQEIDEEFVSGPETFNDVNARSEVSFPKADPSTAELAGRIEQEVRRTRAAVQTASDQASTASTLALIALIVGGLAMVGGLTVGGLALRRARS